MQDSIFGISCQVIPDFRAGSTRFQEGRFCRKKFPCGFYEDGDLLNDILGFRRESLEDHFKNLERSVSMPGKIAGMAGVRMIMPDNSGRDPELYYN